MKTEALVQKVHKATPDEQKLIAQILAAPEPVKHSLLEALSEMSKQTSRSKFLQYVVAAVVEVSKEVKIATALNGQMGGFEAMVEVFT